MQNIVTIYITLDSLGRINGQLIKPEEDSNLRILESNNIVLPDGYTLSRDSMGMPHIYEGDFAQEIIVSKKYKIGLQVIMGSDEPITWL